MYVIIHNFSTISATSVKVLYFPVPLCEKKTYLYLKECHVEILIDTFTVVVLAGHDHYFDIGHEDLL